MKDFQIETQWTLEAHCSDSFILHKYWCIIFSAWIYLCFLINILTFIVLLLLDSAVIEEYCTGRSKQPVQRVLNSNMYIQPRHLSKMLTSYERLKQKKMDQNLVQLKAAGVKNVPKFFLGLNNIKVNDKEEVDIRRAVDGDEDVILFDGEERSCSNNDNDDPSGSKTNEVNGTGPRNKKDCSSAQPLRKSQRTQEQGGSTQGATQAQQLPTSPTEQPDMFCTPHTVVGCVETPASPSRTSQNLKRKRGPTKLKTIAIDGSSRIEVKFDGNGEPIGEGSVKLSSFLGPLVREIVPYTLKDWRKLPSAMAEILWQSIKVRFNLHEEWHRQMVFRRMNEDWRASKSILVKKIRNASNEEERLKLQPDNVKSLHDWKDFVKEKTSKEFKVYGLIKKCCCDFLLKM
ncbi:uncharacterized protein LOC131303364 [Rhododendron vialii]|uniref:uncharacterized protein LOC131303364 n=1 Tax=Rhododendron vialii TaxID=182163 RepID=UPI00265DF58B|nr:uncharacterized protein LOC131303364 [Rhododendron vialii]